MKKVAVFIFLILVFPLISSVTLDVKSEIPQGETTIAILSGNFIDAVSKSNVEFYRGYARVSFDYDVGKIGGNYYIYFQTLNKAENNYSIIVKNARYYVGAQISDEEISKNFTITNATADFYVDKGFVVTDGNFSLNVQNLNPETITINIQTTTNSGSTGGFFKFLFEENEINENSVSLLSGEIKKIDIALENINATTTRTITLSSENTQYEILAYVVLENVHANGTTGNESNVNVSNNDTEVEYKNETDSSSFWDFFKKENKTEDENKTSGDYEIIIDDDGNTVAVKDGEILNGSASLKKCSELKGSSCSDNQICNGTSQYAVDAVCCVGTCVKKTANKNSRIIGWSLVGIIIIFLIWFRIKYARTRRKNIDLTDIPKKKF